MDHVVALLSGVCAEHVLIIIAHLAIIVITSHLSVDGQFFAVSSAVNGPPFLLMVIDVLLTANVLL